RVAVHKAADQCTYLVRVCGVIGFVFHQGIDMIQHVFLRAASVQAQPFVDQVVVVFVGLVKIFQQFICNRLCFFCGHFCHGGQRGRLFCHIGGCVLLLCRFLGDIWCFQLAQIAKSKVMQLTSADLCRHGVIFFACR